MLHISVLYIRSTEVKYMSWARVGGGACCQMPLVLAHLHANAHVRTFRDSAVPRWPFHTLLSLSFDCWWQLVGQLLILTRISLIKWTNTFSVFKLEQNKQFWHKGIQGKAGGVEFSVTFHWWGPEKHRDLDSDAYYKKRSIASTRLFLPQTDRGYERAGWGFWVRSRVVNWCLLCIVDLILFWVRRWTALIWEPLWRWGECKSSDKLKKKCLWSYGCALIKPAHLSGSQCDDPSPFV